MRTENVLNGTILNFGNSRKENKFKKRPFFTEKEFVRVSNLNIFLVQISSLPYFGQNVWKN